MAYKYPDEGGCWYCHTDYPPLVFCREFDTYIHKDCAREAYLDSKAWEKAGCVEDVEARLIYEELFNGQEENS